MADNIFAKSPVEIATARADARSRSIFDGMRPDTPEPGAGLNFDTLARQTQVPQNIIEAAHELAGAEGIDADGFAAGFSHAVGQQIAAGQSVKDAVQAIFHENQQVADAVLQRAVQLVQPQAEESPEPVAETEEGGSAAGDLARRAGSSVLRGAGAAVEGMGRAFDRQGGVQYELTMGPDGEAQLDVTDEPSDMIKNTREAGDALREKGKGIAEGISTSAQEAMEKSQFKGDLIKPWTWELPEEPSVEGLAHLTVEVLGSMAPVVVASIASRKPIVGAGVGGSQSAGAGAEDARDLIEQAAQDVDADGVSRLERESPYYRELIAQGMSPEEATQITSEAAQRTAAGWAAIPGAAGGAATGRILQKPLTALASRNAAVRVGGTAAISAVEEGSQEVAEKVAGRAGVESATGLDVDLTEDTVNDFVLGAMGGGPVGAAAGVRRDAGTGDARDLSQAIDAAEPGEAAALPLQDDANTMYLDEAGNPTSAPEQSLPAPEAPPQGPLSRAAALAPEPVDAPAPIATPNMVEGSVVRLNVPGGAPIEAVFKEETESGLLFEQDGNRFLVSREEFETGEVSLEQVNPITEPQPEPVLVEQPETDVVEDGFENITPEQAIVDRIVPPPSELDDFTLGEDRANAILQDVQAMEQDLGVQLSAIERQAVFTQLNENGGSVEDALWSQLEKEPEEYGYTEPSQPAVQDPGPPITEPGLSPEGEPAGDGTEQSGAERSDIDAGSESTSEPGPVDVEGAASEAQPEPDAVDSAPVLQDRWWRSLPKTRHAAKQLGLSKEDLGEAWGDKAALSSAVNAELQKRGHDDLAEPKTEPTDPIEKKFASNREAAKNFKKGDRVEYTNEGFDPPRVFTATVKGHAAKSKGTVELRVDGGRNGNGYDVTIGAAGLRPEGQPTPPEQPGEDGSTEGGPTKEDIDTAAAEADPNPTPAQAEAGNYKKGRFKWNGLDMVIETAKGEERRGTAQDGTAWSVTMPAHYGDIKRTEGADGDPVDFYMGENPESDQVFIVDQVEPETGKFDEHKVVLGANNREDAHAVYVAGFSDGTGESRMGAMTEHSVDSFKEWLNTDDTKQPADSTLAGSPEPIDQEPVKSDEPEKEAENPEVEVSKPDADAEKEGGDQEKSAGNPDRIEDFGEKIGGARKDMSGPSRRSGGGKSKSDKPAWMKRYAIGEIAADSSSPDAVGKFQITDTKTGRQVRTNYRTRLFDTREEAEMAIPLIEVSRNHGAYSDGSGGFAIKRRVSDRKRPTVKSGFTTREEALAHMAVNAVDIIETKLRVDDSIHPALEAALREGSERREGGKDVGPKDFTDVFGFRGVEFGNWNNTAERQHILNQAYDALLDLAEIIAKPPAAISLNGELALAFGSRGHGLQGARAHYERNYGVINLTKIKGAGSLAHEWMHALDHYFGRLDGKASSKKIINARGDEVFDAKDQKKDYSSHGFRYNSGLRDEVTEAIREVMNTIYRRRQEFQEDRSTRERIAERQTKTLDDILTRFLEDLGTKQSYGRKKDAATGEQMNRARKAVERIEAGDLGEMVEAPTKARYATYAFYEPVLELAEIYKEVRGRQAYGERQGRRIGIAIDIQNGVTTRQQAQQFLDDAKTQKQKTKTVRTEFASEAWRLDERSAKDYWSTNHEMIARAFESFVYDRLKDMEARNDFLAYEKHNDLIEYKLVDVKPYPEGEERASINKAFQNLFDVIETRETETGVQMHKRSSGTVPRSELVDLKDTLNAELDRMGLKGRATVRAWKQLSAGPIALDGLYVHGEINVSMKAVDGPKNTFRHEVIHLLRDGKFWGSDYGLFTQAEWRSLVREARSQKDLMTQVKEDYPDLPNAAQIEEVIAEMYRIWGEQRDASSPLVKVFQKISAALKAFANALRGSGHTDAASVFERIENGQIGGRGPNPDRPEGGNPRHSVSKSVRDKISAVWNGTAPDGPVVTGRLPAVFRALTGKDNPIVIASSVIRKAGNHGLTEQDVLAVIEGLEDPVMVFDSTNESGNLTALVETLAEDGRPLVAAVDTNFRAARIEVSRIATIHGKDHVGAITGWMRDGYMRYINKKKAGEWSQSIGRSLPKEATVHRRKVKILQHRDVFKPDGTAKHKRTRQNPGFESGISVQSKDLAKGAKQLVSDALTQAMAGSNGVNLLALVPGRALMEELGGKMPSIKKYLGLKEKMDTLRNERHAMTDELAQRWRKILSKNQDANTRMMDLMHDSTIEGVDPSEPFVPVAETRDPDLVKKYGLDSKTGRAAQDRIDQDAKRSAAHERLKTRFDKLPLVFREMFSDVRDAYADLADEFESAIEANAEKAMTVAVRRAERTHAKRLEEIRDDGLTGKEKDEAISAANAALKMAKAQNRWSKNARLASLRDQFERNRVSGPYFPLSRFGDFYVTLRDKEGAVTSFSRFEKAREQRQFAEEMRAEGHAVETGVIKEMQARDIVDPGFVADVEALLEEVNAGDQVMDAVWQRWLHTLPDMSARKNRIHRKARAGYSGDAFRAFGSQMFHGAHQLARLTYSLDMGEALDVAEQDARHSDNPERNGLIVKEVARRHDYIMNPAGSAWAQTITGAAFVYYLSMTPAAALVNLSQTVIVGIPILGAYHGKRGQAVAAKQLLRASQDFARGKAHAVDSKHLTPDEKRAMQDAYDRGTVDKSQSHDLAGVGETGVEYSPVRTKVMGTISWMFHHAERANREVTFLAGYRMAKDKGLSHGDAVARAADLTWKTHFDYQNTSRPRLLQNDYLRVAMVFRNFQINMLWRLFRDTHQALHGESAAVKTEARRQLVGISAQMLFNAGIKGVWGYSLLMSLVGLFFAGGSDEAEKELEKAMASVLPRDVAGALLNGVPGHALGIDLQSRVGMPDLWFRASDRQLEGEDEYNYWVQQLLGAGPGIAQNIHRGVEQISEGHAWRGTETIMPKAIRDVMRAGRYWYEGAQTYNGDPIIDKFKPQELLAQVIGFTPARLAERYDANTRLKNEERAILDKKKMITRDATDAVREGRGIPDSVMKDIERFNSENPEVAISGKSLNRSVKGRAQASARNEFGVILNPRLNRKLRDDAAPLIYSD